MQGRSLVPLLRGASPPDWRTSIYYHYYEYPSVHMVPRHYGIRTTRYKLMHFYQFNEWEFYDLQNDPDELTNRYTSPAHAETVDRLKSELEDLRTAYADDSDVSLKPPAWRAQYRQAGLAGDRKTD
jgi:arylsulfatase A-like enzyme